MKTLGIAALLVLLAGCRQGDPPPSAQSTRTQSAHLPASEDAPAFPSAPSAAAPRPLSSPAHGASVWAVYAYVGQPGPKVREAITMLEQRGLVRGEEVSDGDLACDRGGAEALGVAADSMAVRAYFGSEADAKAFAASLPTRAAGVAKVQAGCAD
jgi:hypothetical protein